MPTPASEWNISDYSAEVDFQALIDHTVKRIMRITDYEKLENLAVDKLYLECKVGFDGTSGQNIYKQSLSDNNERNLAAENSLFITSMVPLELSATLLSPENKVVI